MTQNWLSYSRRVDSYLSFDSVDFSQQKPGVPGSFQTTKTENKLDVMKVQMSN